MSKQTTYDVGYCAPPKKHQWQKGQSGNPSGKKKPQVPKPGLPLLECMQHKLTEIVTITMNGETKEMSMAEALVTKFLHDLISAPLKEKTKSLQVLKNIGVLFPPTQGVQEVEGEAWYSEEDRRLMAHLLGDEDD